jgi:hypothetical protein
MKSSSNEFADTACASRIGRQDRHRETEARALERPSTVTIAKYRGGARPRCFRLSPPLPIIFGHCSLDELEHARVNPVV